MNCVTRLMSPKIVGLQQAIEGGHTLALDEFWQGVEAHGTPLIEPLQDDGRHALVTFLWRGNGETHNVIIISQLSTWYWNGCADSKMTRLLDTDVWYRTYRVPMDLREMYRLAPNDALVHLAEVTDPQVRMATWQPDPRNPHRIVIAQESDTPDLVYSLLEMPNAPSQPWITRRPGVAAGHLHHHRFRSTMLDNERDIWVYRPPHLPADGLSGLLLFYDGDFYTSLIPAPTILDNLMAEGLIPPVMAVLMGNVPGQRLTELIYHPPFFDAVTQELLPWVRQTYSIQTSPAQSVVIGCSAGGAAAAFTGLRHSDLFGNVLCQSGSFWNGPAGYGPDHWRREDDAEYNWLPRQFAIRHKAPVRFYLEAGCLEGAKDNPVPSLLVSNWHLRDVLQAKGYEVHYHEFSGGHRHVCWRGTLAQGLLTLLRGRL